MKFTRVSQSICNKIINTIFKPLILKVRRFFLSIFPLVLFACSSFSGNAYEYSIFNEETIDAGSIGITINGGVVLNQNYWQSIPIKELSDIAWDEDEQLLYAISDEGYLYHIKLSFEKQRLTRAEVVYASKLKENNVSLKKRYSDAEGMTLMNGNNKKKGDSRLFISFENKPRIKQFSTRGDMLRNIRIPAKLRNTKNYRHKNKALESLTHHPQHGLLTAAEYPMKNQPASYQTIYSANGKEWHFKQSEERNSAITALEVLDDEKILVLERAYFSLFSPFTIKLREIDLKTCQKQQACASRTIAKLSTAKGWLIDNFEGLTHLGNGNYLMVSDDNNNPIQKTIMVVFQIKKTHKQI